MKRKSILVAIIIVAISLVGCSGNSKTGNNATGNPNTANNSTGNMDGNNITGNPNTANNATDNTDTTKNATGNTDNDITNSTGSINNALNYTATNFRDDFRNAGYKLEDSANTNKNYFGGKETDYLMGKDVVRVYEYNSANDLQTDVNRISQNGLTINGTDANYTRKPYYYRKGNSLIMYEGNEPAYTDHFKTMYGNTLIP
ncbi:hypothetical protein psyc5s11_26820 [Clostridium gelidum]|uniref:Lipoprotein n=1 Tax=Clostridium gelidum TaxID=704125 RepID=A0ABN6IWU8_9CLOT|nr:hypothetical protein [Clostridium gelidum]BCZ46615.1 hypothetical protein psyc5s11_26820 [Clostridium gelidum]